MCFKMSFATCNCWSRFSLACNVMISSGRPSSTDTVVDHLGAPSKPPCSSYSIDLIVKTSFLATYSSLSAKEWDCRKRKVRRGLGLLTQVCLTLSGFDLDLCDHSGSRLPGPVPSMPFHACRGT